jgi:hypothetical protein
MDWGVGGERSFADVVNLVMMPALQGSDGLRMIRKRHNNFSPDQSDASPTKRTSVRGGTAEDDEAHHEGGLGTSRGDDDETHHATAEDDGAHHEGGLGTHGGKNDETHHEGGLATLATVEGQDSERMDITVGACMLCTSFVVSMICTT